MHILHVKLIIPATRWIIANVICCSIVNVDIDDDEFVDISVVVVVVVEDFIDDVSSKNESDDNGSEESITSVVIVDDDGSSSFSAKLYNINSIFSLVQIVPL